MRCKSPLVTMISKSKPPMMTHQPGLPADSASCEKPGSSPKPPSKTLHDALVRCHLNNGPVPKIGGLVWIWSIWTEEWKSYHVLGRVPKRLGAPWWTILDVSNGNERDFPTNICLKYFKYFETAP